VTYMIVQVGRVRRKSYLFIADDFVRAATIAIVGTYHPSLEQLGEWFERRYHWITPSFLLIV